MSTEEEREFQLEMLKVQIKQQTKWSSLTLLIAVEFAAFTSLAATFLNFGLTSGNNLYLYFAISSLVCLYVVTRGTFDYMESKKVERVLDESIEKEIQFIHDKFITKKTEQKETKKETPATTSQADKGEGQTEPIALIAEYRVLNEAIWRRGRDNILMIALMIPATLGLVTFAIQSRSTLGINDFTGLPTAGFVPLVSLILILVSYLWVITSTKLDNICFERLHEIENILHIKGHQFILERIKCNTWFKVRRNMWHLIFPFFIGVYLFTAYWLFTHTVIP